MILTYDIRHLQYGDFIKINLDHFGMKLISLHEGRKEKAGKMEDSRKKRLERMKRYRARNKIKSGSVPKKLEVLTREDFRLLKAKGVPKSTLRRLRQTAGIESSSSSSESVDADDEQDTDEEGPPSKRRRLFKAAGSKEATSSDESSAGGEGGIADYSPLPSGIAPLPAHAAHDAAEVDVGIPGPDIDGDVRREGKVNVKISINLSENENLTKTLMACLLRNIYQSILFQYSFCEM